MYCFVENGSQYHMNTHIIAMETKPGVLLKLTANTSPALFESAVNDCDVTATCGHLLSLLALNKGLENVPLPLLANHVKTALIKLQATDEAARDTGTKQTPDRKTKQQVIVETNNM